MFAEQGGRGSKKAQASVTPMGILGEKNFQSKDCCSFMWKTRLREAAGQVSTSVDKATHVASFPGRGTFPHLEHMFAVLPIFSLVGR